MAGGSSYYAREGSSRRNHDSTSKSKSKSSRSSRGGDVDRGLGELEDTSTYSSSAKLAPRSVSDSTAIESFNNRRGSSSRSGESKDHQRSRAVGESEADYDSHIPVQFPGQFPGAAAEPYLPNMSGQSANYSGVRPDPPAAVPTTHGHPMPASGMPQPTPGPSNTVQIGAAAEYYDPSATFGPDPSQLGIGRNRPHYSPSPNDYGLASAHGERSEYEHRTNTTGTHSSSLKPGLSAAAAGHAIHDQNGSERQSSLYSPPPSYPAANPNAALFASGSGTGAGPGPGPYYAGGTSAYQGGQSGSMAFQRRRRRGDPFHGFVEFWRDPVGVGQFEDYTEAIGDCKYCFEPGTSSRDAPRKHHYHHYRYSNGRGNHSVKAGKRGRYGSLSPSDGDRGIQRGSSKGRQKSASWLPTVIGGVVGDYAPRSVVSDNDDDWYYEEDSPSPERLRSSTSKRRRSMGAAVGAALGISAHEASKPRNRSGSPRKALSRSGSLSSSPSSSVASIPRRRMPRRSNGFDYFFTAPSANRRKSRARRHSSRSSRRDDESFSSSFSSFDADLIFGSTVSSGSRRTSRSDTGSHKSDRDIDAELIGLGASATALASASSRSRNGRHRRSGEVLANKGARSRQTSPVSGTENDEWVDFESDESSSDASRDLDFGDSEAGFFSSRSALGLPWLWGWGGKKSGKSKKDREVAAPSSSYDEASTLRNVHPIASSDPSRFDADSSSSFTGIQQPPLVHPGAIPLQQPQPVTPVSQSVYYTQSETQSVSAPIVHPLTHLQKGSPQGVSLSLGTGSVVGGPTTSRRRSSSGRDSSTVQFDLTKEQEEKQRQVERRETRSGERRGSYTFQSDKEKGTQRGLPEKDGSEERRDVQRLEGTSGKGNIGIPAATDGLIGAVGAGAVASEIPGSSKTDDNDSSGAGGYRRYSEYRQKRRAERRQLNEPGSVTDLRSDTSSSSPVQAKKLPPVGQRQQQSWPQHEHDEYASFFAPDDLRHGRGDRESQREKNLIDDDYLPDMVERQSSTEWRNASQASALPQFTLNPPTPEVSTIGTAADTTTMVTSSSRPRAVSEKSRRETDAAKGRGVGQSGSTSSRVSWGEHQTHEYEVLSSTSEEEVPQHDGNNVRQSPRRSAADRRRRERAAQAPFSESKYSSSDRSSSDIKGDPSTRAYPDYNRDAEFTATVAAAAQATGFDPRMVTSAEPYASTMTTAGPTPFYAPWREQPHSRGFVEGEVQGKEGPSSVVERMKSTDDSPRSSSNRQKDYSRTSEYDMLKSPKSRDIQEDGYGYTEGSNSRSKSKSKSSKSRESTRDGDKKRTSDIYPDDEGIRQRAATSTDDHGLTMRGGFEGEFSEENRALKPYSGEINYSSLKRDDREAPAEGSEKMQQQDKKV